LAVDKILNLNLKIHGLKNTKGRIIIMIDNNEISFKSATEKDSYGIFVITPSEKEINFNISPIKSGKVAVTIIHDENNNGKLDTNFLGIPTEGIGFSVPISISENIKFSDIAVVKDTKDLTILIGIGY
jgi:uncharacterized protein (DUF2141 family)